MRGARLLALAALLLALCTLPPAEAGKKKKRGVHRRAAAPSHAAVGADGEVSGGGGGSGAAADHELDEQDFGDEDSSNAATNAHKAKPANRRAEAPNAGGVKQYVPPRTDAYVLEHSLGKGWSRRASIDVSYVEGHVTADISEQEPLDSTILSHLKELAESGGMYRVRVRLASAGNAAPVTLASARASSILSTGLSDEITLHVGASASPGAISLLEYAPRGSSTRRGAASSEFSTTVSIAQAGAAVGDVPSRIGPSPFAPKEQQQADGKGAKKDAEQPGFLRRYWYIILPIVLMQLMGAPAPEGGAAGQGGAGRRAAPAS